MEKNNKINKYRTTEEHSFICTYIGIVIYAREHVNIKVYTLFAQCNLAINICIRN